MKSERIWVGALTMLLVAGLAAAQDATSPPATPATPSDEDAAAEEESGPSYEVGLDYANRYVFRGVNLLGEDQEVWVPRASVAFGNISVWSYGYLGSFDHFDDDGEPLGEQDYLEFDLGVDYTFALDSLSLTVGALTYRYGSHAELDLGFLNTYEVYVIAAWDLDLAPTISYYHDVDAVDGGYLSIGISHSIPLGDRASLDLSGAFGIDNKYNSEESFEANDILLGVDLPFTINDTYSAHVLVQQSLALAALDSIEQDDETIVTVGMTASF